MPVWSSISPERASPGIGEPRNLRALFAWHGLCYARPSSTIAEVSDPERRRGPMTAGTAVAVPSISPRNAERPVLDAPAPKMLNGFPRRVLASRLATLRSSQQFPGLHRTLPIRPDLVWVPARSGPSFGLATRGDPPGRSDRRPASWAVYRLDLAGWSARRPRRSAPICVVRATTVAARPGHQGTGWGSP